MINLFENYSQGSWDLHYSLIVAGYVNTTVCLSDDGFLPSDVTSPYLYFTGFDKVQGSALYFNQVPVPDYWEIIGTNSNAEIFRFDKNVVIFIMRILLTNVWLKLLTGMMNQDACA